MTTTERRLRQSLRRARERPPAAPRRSRRGSTRPRSSSTSTSSSEIAQRSAASWTRGDRPPAPRQDPQERRASRRIQLAGRRVGMTVGDLGEAEVFAGAGIDDVFLAYPIWAERPEGGSAARARTSGSGCDCGSGSTRSAGRERLAAAVAGTGRPLHVLLEIDPGNRRTGAPARRARSRSRARRATPGLEVARRLHPRRSRLPRRGPRSAGADEVRTLTAAADALRATGIELEVISAGSTPTMLTAAAGAVNEIRAGTYSIGDRQQWALGAIPAEGCAVAVAATVVVAAVDDRVVIDAGAKALTKDRRRLAEGHGAIRRLPGCRDRAGERLPRRRPRPARGRAAGARRGRRGRSRTTSARSSTCVDSFVATRGGDGRSASGRSTRAVGAAESPERPARHVTPAQPTSCSTATARRLAGRRSPSMPRASRPATRRSRRAVPDVAGVGRAPSPGLPASSRRVDGAVVGWTALGRYSGRDVYRGVAWESVYVAERARGRGDRAAAARDA